MCESTRRWIMSGFLGMALVLATVAMVADSLWQPRAAILPPHVVAGSVT